MHRRTLLLAATTLPLITSCSTWAARGKSATATIQLTQLEKSFNGRIGVYAINSADNTELSYRGTERFPFCSTFKMMLASAILQRSVQDLSLLTRRIMFKQSDLVSYSPLTEKRIADGMTVAELCAAALQYSDNSAANQLMKIIGGPAEVTAFAHSIGDTEFHLDRWETTLNSAIPHDPRDTTTPQAMAKSLGRLVLKDALPPSQRKQLQDWMLGNTTGATRIKAGIPTDWLIADKTGSGDYGTVNDIAVIWPPQHAPIVVTVYTTQFEQNTKERPDVVAAAGRIVAEWGGMA